MNTYSEFRTLVVSICDEYDRNRKITGFMVQYVEPWEEYEQIWVTFLHENRLLGRLRFKIDIAKMDKSSPEEIRNFIAESIGAGVKNLIVDLLEIRWSSEKQAKEAKDGAVAGLEPARPGVPMATRNRELTPARPDRSDTTPRCR